MPDSGLGQSGVEDSGRGEDSGLGQSGLEGLRREKKRLRSGRLTIERLRHGRLKASRLRAGELKIGRLKTGSLKDENLRVWNSVMGILGKEAQGQEV